MKIFRLLLKLIKWVCILIVILILLLVLYIIAFYTISSISQQYREFIVARHVNLEEIRILSEAKPKELLLYRRKEHTNRSKSASDICYVSYIKLNKSHGITPSKLENHGYNQIEKTHCVADTNNLADLKSSFAAPNFSYLGHVKGNKEFLVFGSKKNLDITSISDTKTQIWHKKGYEIVLYPQENIIRVNRLWTECWGLLGMCN